MIVAVSEGMDDPTFNRFKQQLDDEHTGTQNWRRPLIIEGASKVTP